MFQDINPHEFSNAFRPRAPRDGDYALVYADDKVWLYSAPPEEYAGRNGAGGGKDINAHGGAGTGKNTDAPADGKNTGAQGGAGGGKEAGAPGEADYDIPKYEQFVEIAPSRRDDLIYLFDVDDAAFFYMPAHKLADGERARLAEKPAGSFRSYQERWLAFAGITACHLASWYERRRLCGKCGAETRRSEKERMLECPACAAMYYPRISPAVIVGVTDGDKLLLTRYVNRPPGSFALIAGFAEIGESIEGTVRREVMEEVGLRVKNLRFYKSQPWGFSGSLLMGFYCDLDGNGEITLDNNELGYAEWTERGAIAVTDASFSLTGEMIEAFRTADNL